MKHTHFGSGTFLVQAFTSVLVAGTAWRLAWSHALRWGARHGSMHVVKFARAALYQY
jgi:hypothetical protein